MVVMNKLMINDHRPFEMNSAVDKIVLSMNSNEI
jgi:hypothetical protein